MKILKLIAKALLLVLLTLTLSGCAGPQEAAVLPAVPDGEENVTEQRLTFLYFADTQANPETGNYSGFSELMSAALAPEPKPDMILFGGDTVNDGGDPNEWLDFWQAAGTLPDGLLKAAVVGNHDNYVLLAEQFDLPSKAPESLSGGFNYSFSLGPVFFLMLDSNILGAADEKDVEWLLGEMQSEAAQNAAWRVAVMHHPMWTPAEIPRDVQRAETMREHFLPVMEAGGLDLILCGHQHFYSRSVQIRGITQIMAASGGKASYTANNHDYMAVVADAPNYLRITASSVELTVSAYDVSGSIFDTLTLTKTQNDDEELLINVLDPEGDKIWSFSEAALARAQIKPFAHAYSTINNWPNSRFYAAEGYGVSDILRAAGIYDIAQTITLRAGDGYEISLTRQQFTAPQFFYPHVGENETGAEPVIPIISYRWREGTDDLSEVRYDRPILIIGQRNVFEHTNPAFVVGVSEIIVYSEPADVWPMASTFPLQGSLAAGDTVKLQHASFGLVKLHYTLDGSTPTLYSPMYNPSTFQTELNRPIPITGPTVIKVLVSGYGKDDSEIAVFEFTPVS